MSFLKCDEEFSVGVASIDEQHKRMVEIVAALYNSMVSGMSDETFERVFDGLVDCTCTHFKHEEDFFATTRFPLAEQHTQQHEDLKRHIATFRTNVLDRSSPIQSLEMMNFLKIWLMDHIQGEDKKLGAHLNGLGIH